MILPSPRLIQPLSLGSFISLSQCPYSFKGQKRWSQLSSSRPWDILIPTQPFSCTAGGRAYVLSDCWCELMFCTGVMGEGRYNGKEGLYGEGSYAKHSSTRSRLKLMWCVKGPYSRAQGMEGVLTEEEKWCVVRNFVGLNNTLIALGEIAYGVGRHYILLETIAWRVSTDCLVAPIMVQKVGKERRTTSITKE